MALASLGTGPGRLLCQVPLHCRRTRRCRCQHPSVGAVKDISFQTKDHSLPLKPNPAHRTSCRRVLLGLLTMRRHLVSTVSLRRPSSQNSKGTGTASDSNRPALGSARSCLRGAVEGQSRTDPASGAAQSTSNHNTLLYSWNRGITSPRPSRRCLEWSQDCRTRPTDRPELQVLDSGRQHPCRSTANVLVSSLQSKKVMARH